jgi:hypothetical protein
MPGWCFLVFLPCIPLCSHCQSYAPPETFPDFFKLFRARPLTHHELTKINAGGGEASPCLIWQNDARGRTKVCRNRLNVTVEVYGMSIFTIWPVPAGAAPKLDT